MSTSEGKTFLLSCLHQRGKHFYCHVKHKRVKKRDKGETGLIKASCFFKVFVWIITVVFKVVEVAIICLS